MKRTTRTASVAIALLAVAGLSVPSTATAVGRPLTAQLLGANELGGGDPDGAGTAHVWVTPGLDEICYDLTVTGLADVTLAHIHVGAATENGPVVVPLQAPTSGSSGGCVSVNRDLAVAIVSQPSAYYVNVHTLEFPGGAVRGQLS
ncbi:CHRD domain-containing protein [Terrabacter sp. GCM10028922]|uniref:CHRD domain-containing protein n=1 Tax=Terrabacter sp. GCM10028922 TaxID=3273428 RepID=UPI00360F8922